MLFILRFYRESRMYALRPEHDKMRYADIVEGIALVAIGWFGPQFSNELRR
jgi:hypothetical protein